MVLPVVAAGMSAGMSAAPSIASAAKAAMVANKLRVGAKAAGVKPGSAMNAASMAAKMKGMGGMPTAAGMKEASRGFFERNTGLIIAFIVGLSLFSWGFYIVFGKYFGSKRQLGPRVSRQAPEERNYDEQQTHGEHKEFMFGKKSSRENNYKVEKSATMGPGAQTSTDLGGFFGMRAPGAVLGQRPIGAPIKPPATGSTRSLRLNKQPATGEIRRGSDGITIDANEGVEEEFMEQEEVAERAQMRVKQAERRSARSNKVLNNTGHSEQISEIVASTTLSAGNDFKGMFGRNSARYSNRDVQSRYIEPILKQEKPNMH